MGVMYYMVGRVTKLLDEMWSQCCGPDVITYNVLNNGICKEGKMSSSSGTYNVLISGYMSSKKILKINPKNSIMEESRKRADADKNDELVKDLVLLPFETALLTSGSILDEPNTFDNKIHCI